jgi:hypothetical protein
MGSNHMHDMFRDTFNEKPKINEKTGEIILSGETRPIKQEIWIDTKEKK